MNPLLRLVKCLWNTINFIRDLIMNIFFVFFILCLAVMISLFSGKKESLSLNGAQGALLLNLDGYLADNQESSPGWENTFRELNNERIAHKISTFDVLYALRQAAQDERIQGLVLDLNYFDGADLPALTSIGNALNAFKLTGKPVIAYAKNYSQGQYLLASYADEIYLNPIGEVTISGLRQETLYFKELLDRLAVTSHVFRVGTYKSAVEPFLRSDMSPDARENMQRWLEPMWRDYVAIIAQNRQISTQQVLPSAKRYLMELNALKGDGTAYTMQRKLVTGLATEADFDRKMTALFGKNEAGRAKLFAFEDYLAALPDRMEWTSAPNKIAVVNVEGTIVDGESDESSAGGDTIAGLLREAYQDDAVKAVVLRVNSPGGSAFASELIRQEIDHLQAAGKPVVVSMGAMAASGGYWIAATSDYIVADKNTITGSIGIFALLPTFENSIKKLGMNADGVSTTDLAEGSAFSPLSQEMSDIYQLQIEHGYDRFLDLVAQGRNLDKKQVDKIAQGQVWLGSDAYKYKLVDELGDFTSAVKKAEELVNLQRVGEQIDEFSVEWLTEDESGFIGKLWRNMNRNGGAWLAQFVLRQLGLPAQSWQSEFIPLSKFNDPKGQYLYCLTCGAVK